jgi:hypothetical protein
MKLKIFIICIALIFTNCASNSKDIYDVGFDKPCINNNEEAYLILDINVVDMTSKPFSFGGPTGTGSQDKERTGRYLAKIDLKSGEIKVIKKIEDDYKNLICKNNIIAFTYNNQTIFFNTTNYEEIKRISAGCYLFYDFTLDLNKIIIDPGPIVEYNDITKTNTILKPFPNSIRDAKYCPIDETIIAYIGASNTADNMAGDIYLIKNDGSGNTLVVSGYNAENIYWHPDGDTIVFITKDKIYSVNKSGTNVKILKEVSLPERVSYSLYYNLFLYIIYPQHEIKIIGF